METEELTKLVDGIYKNILEKFNPGARQMITAGKAYLKALHGAAAASRIYVDAISKLGRQAQQGTWGCSADIGTALMKVVEVYKEIQDQQMNILKAFYVDLLVPLETNLEKDTKVVQSEQKRFMQQHKARTDSYSKAVAASKKQRKRNTRNAAKAASEVDKELKSLQILEEEKNKLTSFCEQSLKNAMTQERRRYGFVLERQCSLAGHWLAAHAAAAAAHRSAAVVCRRAAASRETLPASVHDMFTNKVGQQISLWPDDEDVYANPAEASRSGSAIRKARSVEASSADVRDLDEPSLALERAKSDFSLHANMHDLDDEMKPTTTRRPKSFAAPTQALQREVPIARAIYPYHSTGENQLSFQEGDTLVLLGDRTKGWQYGENLRTQMAGWFPLAYTEVLVDESIISPSNLVTPLANSTPSFDVDMEGEEALVDALPIQQQMSHTVSIGNEEGKTARMFGDTLQGRKSSNPMRRLTNISPRHHGPPPTLPAPVPSPSVPNSKKMPHSQSSSFHSNSAANQHVSGHMKSSGSNSNFVSNHDGKNYIPQTLPTRGQVGSNKNMSKAAPIGNMSLHSSNDSGFSNEPPPQPDIDYSDEEMMSNRNRVPIRSDQQSHIDDKIRTQSLLRSKSKDNSNNILMQSRTSYMEGDLHMLTMDKDSHGIKRTKSFWKFGRTSQDDIMVGMSLWQHRDLVDTVPAYKQNETREKVEDINFNNNNNNNNLSNQNAIPNHKTHASSPQSNVQIRRQPSQTIDRKEILRNADSTRQSQKVIPMEQNVNTNKMSHTALLTNKTTEPSPSNNKNYKQPYSTPEEEYNKTALDAQSNHSDFTNGSTIKTNFENSFYDDENGEGLIIKTVKRKEILQRYDNNDVSDENSNSSSTDPYDCIIVDDHLKSNKMHKVSSGQHRSPKMRNDSDSGRKHQKNNASKMEEDLPRTHVRTKLFADRKHNVKNERNNVIEDKPPQKLETFKTFKDNENEIKILSESSETLKYKDYEQNDDQYYYESQTMMIHREDNPRQIEKGAKYIKNNNVDVDLTKYNKQTNYNDRYYRNQENNEFHYNDQALRSNGHYDPRQNNQHVRNEDVMNNEIHYRENNFTGRYSDHREEKGYSNQDTDSRKAAKTKKYNKQDEQSMRHSYEEQTLHRKSSGHKYISGQSDDQKFDEVMKQQKPQLLPRTKLFKATNVGATMQTIMKFEQEIGMMSKQREKSKSVEKDDFSETGHTFGPWYDLWDGEIPVRK